MTHLRKSVLATLAAACLWTLPVNGNPPGDIKNTFNPINTAVPALSIAPDARGGGMGDIGAATTPDVHSQYWNPAKYAFHYSKAGVSLSYTPWLRKIVNDVALAYVSGFYKLGDNDQQAIGTSLRYFSLGEIAMTEYGGAVYNQVTPYEMAFDVSYSRKLSESYSMAVALRYIRSDMGAGVDDDIQAGNAFSADVAGYLNKYVVLGSSECLWALGFNISNIGTKVSYDGGTTNQFLPTNLKIGTSLLYPLDDYNTISFNLDLNKYLVPTVPVYTGSTPEDQAAYQKKLDDFNSLSPISGIFKSFGDAPGGLSEELKEVMVSVGTEYSYNEQFFVRGGYYYENVNKGNRQYFSLGAGFRMSVFQLDAAYLISTIQSNPLDQTLRFSLSFDMDGLRSLVQ